MNDLNRTGVIVGLLMASISWMTWYSVDLDNNSKTLIIIGISVVVALSLFWSRITRQKITPQYDAKKLNENIYKKLMRVSCSYNPFFFSEKLGFVVPSDERAFSNKNSGSYQVWMFESVESSSEQKYNRLDNVVPNLHIGEKYLKRNYNKIYKEWMSIKQFVETHNKKHDNFLELLGKKFIKQVSSELPTFVDFAKTKNDKYENVIYLKNVAKILYDSIQHNLRVDGDVPYFDKKRDFDDLFVSRSRVGDFWVLDHSRTNGTSLLFSDTKDDWNVENLQKILNSILNDPKNAELYQKSRDYDFNELYEKIESFNDRLENEVVHDIDNQLL